MAKTQNVIFALAHIIGYYGSFKDTLSALFAADDSIRGSKLRCLEQARNYIEAEIINLQQQSESTYSHNKGFEDPDSDTINEAISSITNATESYNDITTEVNKNTERINNVDSVKSAYPTYVSYF